MSKDLNNFGSGILTKFDKITKDGVLTNILIEVEVTFSDKSTQKLGRYYSGEIMESVVSDNLKLQDLILDMIDEVYTSHVDIPEIVVENVKEDEELDLLPIVEAADIEYIRAKRADEKASVVEDDVEIVEEKVAVPEEKIAIPAKK